MSTKLPDEIQVQELARDESSSGGVRYVFPRRRVPTLLRVIGSVLLLFGIFWTVVCLAMLVGGVGIAIKIGDREAWFFGVIFTLMTLVFAAIGCLPMWIGCLIAFGRDVVELRDGKVMHIARAGPFWHRKSRSLASLRRFVVSVSEGGLTVLNVEVEAADKLALATMYPREWLVLVAEELSQRSAELLGRSVDAGTAPVEVIEEATVKTARRWVWQDDPVAANTKWSAASSSSAGFRTRQLVQRGDDRLEFPTTLVNLLVSVVILLFGVVFTVPAFLMFGGAINWDWGPLVFVSFGMVALLWGATSIYSAISPIVFDRQRGLFWKGSRKPPERLDVIYALQIIINSGDETSTPELNLVLENGSRVNLEYGGDVEHLRKDAERLAEFLNVPLWDAT